jgi:predicted nucleotidyltransferase
VNYLFESHLEEIQVLCQNYQVESLYAIGHSVEDEISGEQVLDLLIDFNGLTTDKEIEQTFRMTYLLEKVFQHKVNLIRWIEAEYLGFLNEENPTRILLFKK